MERNPSRARRRRLGARSSARHPWRVLLAAAVMFAAVAVWRYSNADTLTPIGVLYVVPIVLVSVTFGAWSGVLTAVAALAVTWSWAVGHVPQQHAFANLLVRALLLIGLAAIFGREVARRRRSERRAERWFSLSDELCCVAAPDGTLLRVNASWTRHLGYAAGELLSRELLDLCHPDDLGAARRELAALAGGAPESAGFEARWRARDGSWHWLLWSARADGGAVYAAARDITERKELEQRLEALAAEDPLTGLPNRRAWDARFAQELARARRSGAPLSVGMLDLDGLKELNDGRGHEAGDRLLAEVASRWRAALRDVDYLARLGGDEFAAILPGCGQDDHATVVGRLRAAMPAGRSVSVGVATWDGEEPGEALLRRADDLLYAAKAAQGPSRSRAGA